MDKSISDISCKKGNICLNCPVRNNGTEEQRKVYIKSFCTGYHDQPEMSRLTIEEWDNITPVCKYDRNLPLCPLTILQIL